MDPSNASPDQHEPVTELAVWEFAGLMLTYWCSSKCAFCYVHAGPNRGGDMDVETALALWRSLDQLAAAHGKTMRIHLAGGEPFRDWVRLASIIRTARDAGLTPLEKVETNAFWATDDGLTRARLELLNALGTQKLVVSSDVFHQEFVPFDRVQRCVAMARRVFGPGRVIVRWWDFFQNPVNTRQLSPAAKKQAFKAALEHHSDRLTGRASEKLAPLLPGYPAERFQGHNCLAEVLQSKHVHIDPFGNIFPGTCGGIILGRAAPCGTGFQPVTPCGTGFQPVTSCGTGFQPATPCGTGFQPVEDVVAGLRPGRPTGWKP
ncbi:MAG: hypothetical protein KAY37_02985, partial [Phycisphaerae bacterium]|nr:hypothetical protein [Phycisphaerae bacterium]